MASPQAPEKLMSSMKVTSYPLDADYSTAADIDKWVDMKDFENFLVAVCGINLTGAGPSALSIIADAESDGSGGNIVIATYAGSAPTAEGDYFFLECTAEQIRQEAEDNAKDLRYVSVKLTMANAADECVVTYIRAGAKFPQTGLTVEVIT